MWSDTIFLSRDRAKLLFLARAAEAAYSGGRASLESWVGSPTEIVPHEYGPLALTWIQGGERVCLILGTVSTVEYAFQTSGWLTPTIMGAGYVNSYHLNVAAQIYANSPSDTKLFFGHSMGGAIAGLAGRLASSRPARVVGIGTPRYATVEAVLGGGWAESVYLADPRDVVSETPYLGFGGPLNDWRVPFVEWVITPDGIVFDSPAQSTMGSLSAIAASYGSSYHEVGQYIRALSDPPVLKSKGEEMSSRYRITVRGVMHEQSVINEFWYAPSASQADAGCEALATDFAAKWSSLICPKVSDAYSVLSYDVRRMYGAVSVNPAAPADGSTWRWQEQFIRTGTSADEGLIAAGVAFPSFVAVGFRKTCGGFVGSDGIPVPGLKSPRGGGRIAAPAEIITGASGGNRIVAASLTSWVAALTALKEITISAAPPSAWHMEVVTYTYAGAPILTGTPPVATWRHADVSGIAVNPFLTSQNSRKQTLNRLG